MIKKQGVIEIRNNNADTKELLDSVDELPEGDYEYLIYDKQKNRSLPQLKYLCGVVLKAISDKLPNHPPINALYSYFEEIYAPIKTVIIEGEKYEYFDLKTEKSIEMDDVIEKIIRHAATQWGITAPSRDELKAPEAREAYMDAYTDMWKSFSYKN
ncbi:MAG: hypothetical protein LBI60_02650 [Bacteroidales bacterium]|jgi:hypothetical protein|nr:hypothetical protein [Bacteroidales bacterium]